MQRLLPLLIFVLSMLVAKNAASQELSETLDSLFERKLPQLGLREVKIIRKSGEEVFTETKRYNTKGKQTEHRYNNDGNEWTREKKEFDEKGNPKTSIYYDQDASSIETKYVYTYLDSLNYTIQIFHRGTELSETYTYQTKHIQDTTWLTKTRKTSQRPGTSKTLTRFTQKGDSLLLSENIKFDERGKMVDIITLFELKRKDSAGNTVIESGKYEARIDESLMIYGDPMRNPEPYIQNQLKGMYPYYSVDDYTPSKTYNPGGQLILIQEGYGKTIFHYNELAQLVKFEHVPNPEMTGEKEVITSETTFYYDSQGLPIRITEEGVSNGKTIEYYFEYK